MLSRHIPRPYAVLPLSASYDVSFASPSTPFDIPIQIHSASHHTLFHRPNAFVFMSGPSASLLTSSFFRSAFLLCTVPRLLPFHSATHSIPPYVFIFMSGPVKFRVSPDFFIFRFRARILSRQFPRLVVSRSTYSFLPCPIPFPGSSRRIPRLLSASRSVLSRSTFSIPRLTHAWSHPARPVYFYAQPGPFPRLVLASSFFRCASVSCPTSFCVYTLFRPFPRLTTVHAFCS
jgi:hypothetical protein